MGQKISDWIADVYNNAPPPSVAGVNYAELPDEEKIRQERERLRAQPPSLVATPASVPPEDTLRATPGTPNISQRNPTEISDNTPPPPLIEGVSGYEGEDTDASKMIAGRAAGGVLGAAANIAELPADAADIAYDFIAQGRIPKALGISDQMKGYGVTDLYREVFVDPARRESLRLTQETETSSKAEKLVGALAAGGGNMALQITADKALGAAIVSTITKRNPALGAILIATGAGQNAHRIIPDFVLGMIARTGVTEYHDTNDIVRAGAAMIESGAVGSVMTKIPPGLVKGAAGWAGLGVGEQFMADLKKDEFSDLSTYEFKTAESIGYHFGFAASRRMFEVSQTAKEKAYSNSVLRSLEEDGAVDTRKLDALIEDHATSPEVRREAGRLKMIIADERSRTGLIEDVQLQVTFDTTVKGPDGMPLRVYHGTNRVYIDVSNDKAKGGIYGKGHYFTENATIGGQYALVNRYGETEHHPNTRASYLDIKKPLDMDMDVGRELIELNKTLGEQGHQYIGPSTTNDQVYQRIAHADGWSADRVNEYLQTKGYDGITHYTGSIIGEGTEHRVWIAFDAKQVHPGFTRPENAFRGSPDHNETVGRDVHRSAAEEMLQKVSTGALRQEDVAGDPSWMKWIKDGVINLVDRMPQPGLSVEDVSPPTEPPPPEPAPRQESTPEYIERMNGLLGETEKQIWERRAQQRYQPKQVVYLNDAGFHNRGIVQEEIHDKVKDEYSYRVKITSPNGKSVEKVFMPGEMEGLDKDGKRVTGPLDVNRVSPQFDTQVMARKVITAMAAIQAGKEYSGLMKGIFNFHKLGTNQDAWNVITEISMSAADEIADARAMGQSLKSIERDAMGMKPTMDKMRSWYHGVKNLAQKDTAIRIAFLYSATRLATMAIKSKEPGFTPEEAEEMREWGKTHAELETIEAGMGSEMGRGLGARRINVTAADIMGASTPEDIIKLMSRAAPAPLSRFVAGWLEMYKGWMFTNPGTHITNFVGNMAVQIGNTAEDYIAATIGSDPMRAVRRIPNSQDRITFKEANAKLAGRLHGWKLSNKYMVDLILASSEVYQKELESGKTAIEALRKAEDALNEKGAAPYMDKYNEDTRRFTSLSLFGEAAENITFGRLMGRNGLDLVGMLSRSSLTALGLSDNYFREISYTAAISGIAIRESFKEQRTEDETRDFISGFIKAHTMLFESNLRSHSKADQKQIELYAKDGRFHEEAFDQAAKDIFANDFVHDKNSGAIPGLIEGGRLFLQKAPIMQVLWPTYKTPWNILHYVTQRTPVLNALSQEYRKAMKSPGRERDLAISKMIFGSMMYTLGALLYMNGDLMPDPDNDLTGNMKALGVKKDSIVIGGKSYAVGGADPFGSFLALAGRVMYLAHNTVGISNSGDLNVFDQTYDMGGKLIDAPDMIGAGGQGWKPAEAFAYLMVAGSSLFFDKSVLRQVKDVLNVMGGSPGAYKSGANLLNRTLVGLTLPFNGAFRFANSDNPYILDAEGFVDTYMATAAPNAGAGIKPKYDIFGIPVPNEGKFMWFIPKSTVNPTHSPIRALIAKLELPIAEMLDNEWRGLKLTEDEGERLHQLIAEGDLEGRLNKLMQTGSFQRRPEPTGSIADGTKGDAILEMIRYARRKAHGQLNKETRIKEGQSLTQQIKTKKKGARNDSGSPDSGWEKLTEKFK